MAQFTRTARTTSRIRLILAPALAVAALSLTATASATTDLQPKPQVQVEASRTPQGARLTFKGKNWPAEARIKLTGTRAPGSNTLQDFGMVSADSSGEFLHRSVKACTATNDDDAREVVTITAADSATGVKVTAKVDGASWRCM
jgi:hypothetical protein